MSLAVGQKVNFPNIFAKYALGEITKKDTTTEVPVGSLSTKKYVALYFSASWCCHCPPTTTKLISIYNTGAFKDQIEIIFIPGCSVEFGERGQPNYESYRTTMPWSAIDFQGDNKKFRDFKAFLCLEGWPTIYTFQGDGTLLCVDVGDVSNILSLSQGVIPKNKQADAQAQDQVETERANKLPSTVKDSRHIHPLTKIQGRNYRCDICSGGRKTWGFYCKDCDYDIHPLCLNLNP